MEFQEKNVLVFGSGKSGIAAAELLEKQNANIFVFEGNEKQSVAEIKEKSESFAKAEIYVGTLPEEVMDKLDFVVLSPGVPTDLPLVNAMRDKKIMIIGEIELAYQVAKGKILAITGTNGKTTTTTLVGEILSNYFKDVKVVGNIGIPYTSVAADTTEETVTAAEISSFQLETIVDFAPDVSAILNITPDHLNRHHTMEEYIRVKELITKNQTEEDTCVLNYEDEVLREFGKTLKCQVIFFSSLRTLEKGIYLNGEMIEYNDGTGIMTICSVKELNLPGRHNYENVCAAVAMAMAYGISLEDIRYVLVRFKAVEHRIEYVTEVNGVVYYNDSKGTNPDAAIKGIQAMDRPTLLIGGGYDKNSSYEEWINAFDGKVRYLVLLGQTKEKIAEAAGRCGFEHVIMTESLEEAVGFCAEHANPGDAVLLSPACASWGMFPNYEVRGKRFKELVYQLKNKD